MANWTTFVSQVKTLPIAKQRAVSAIVGAVVADAAGIPYCHICFVTFSVKPTFSATRGTRCHYVLFIQHHLLSNPWPLCFILFTT